LAREGLTLNSISNRQKNEGIFNNAAEFGNIGAAAGAKS
jgi:hypothetical protein